MKILDRIPGLWKKFTGLFLVGALTTAGMKPSARRKTALAAFFLGTSFVLIGQGLVESPLKPWLVIGFNALVFGVLLGGLLLVAKKHRYVFMFFIVAFILVTKAPMRQFTQSISEFQNESDRLEYILEQKNRVAIVAYIFLLIGLNLAARVLRSEVKERTHFETEVKIAHDIQESLIPCATFQNSWCKVAGMTSSATEVGGDYFDIVQLSENLLAIAIADVTGHGVGPGIISAMTKSALRSQLLHDSSPAKVLENLNKTICQMTERGMFVTFAYILLDGNAHTVTYATAGHPPLLYSNTSENLYVQLRTDNLPLAVQPEAQFTEAVMPFSSGDSIVLYTDGVIEAMNKQEEELGIERLTEWMSQQKHCTGEELCARIVDAVRSYSGSDELKDDVTVVCVTL